jgi:hypothetical protein
MRCMSQASLSGILRCYLTTKTRRASLPNSSHAAMSALSKGRAVPKMASPLDPLPLLYESFGRGAQPACTTRSVDLRQGGLRRKLQHGRWQRRSGVGSAVVLAQVVVAPTKASPVRGRGRSGAWLGALAE